MSQRLILITLPFTNIHLSRLVRLYARYPADGLIIGSRRSDRITLNPCHLFASLHPSHGSLHRTIAKLFLLFTTYY